MPPTLVLTLAAIALPLAVAGPSALAVDGHPEPIVAVRTIDPADEDFADLMPLRELIGDARVVALGEQSHGDGACFAAKHRLVRFLHQEMGFDVLAWESGMFDCRLMHEAIAGGERASEAWRKGLFPIFGESAQVRDVLEYVASTQDSPSPIELAGFDCQFSSMAGPEQMPISVQAFFDRAAPSILSEAHPDAVFAIRALTHQMSGGSGEDEEPVNVQPVEDLLNAFETHRARLAQAHSSREIAFARRTLENLIEFDRSNRQAKTNTPADTNIRDRKMGENIAWLATERYPDRKIIVWAASFHLMRNAPDLSTMQPGLTYEDTVPMGHIAHELLGDDWYAVMFTAYDGEAGNPFHGSRPLPPAPQGSLEATLHDRGDPFVFIDLRTLDADHPFAQPIVARPLGYTPMTPKTDWAQHFDAVFHTDTMFPSTRDTALPAKWRTAQQQDNANDPRVRAADLLENARRAVVTYDLNFDAIDLRRAFHEPDPGALDLLAPDQWPDILGHVASDPATFQSLAGDAATTEVVRAGGRIAFTSPVQTAAALDQYTTVLCLDGVGEDARLRLNSYATFFSRGDVMGSIDLRSYATAFIDGDLDGELTSHSYFNMVVTGDMTGTLTLNSSAMVYVLGHFSGSATLSGSRLAIAGRMTRAEIEQRLAGTGAVYLRDSDLDPGEHRIGELTVSVGVRIAPE